MAGSIINLNNTSPAPPSLTINVTWQKGAQTGTDPQTGYPVYPVSANVPYMVGDTGSGGAAGVAPPPPAGSAALGEFLRADGTWAQAVPTPTYVQGATASATPGTSVAPALTGVGLGHTLILHIRCEQASAPALVSSNGNVYVLVHSVASSFWTTYTYTYVCINANSGNETVTATFGGSGAIIALFAEYTAAAGYESVSDVGISGNANPSTTLTLHSRQNYERGIWFYSCWATSGLTFNQTLQLQASPGGTAALMDASQVNSGSITGTVTGTANQTTITGLFLTTIGSVSSVSLAAPAIFTVSGSPVVNIGTLTLGLANEPANQVWAGPSSGGAAAPTFRALVAADLPSGTGTVTSVSLTMPAEFSVAGSPVTSSGGFTVTKASQSANLVYAGPSSGSAAAPTFRALVAADLPAGTGTVTSVGLSAPAEFTVSGSPVTGSGTLTFSKANQAANLVWAGPTSGSPAAPAFRSLVAADLPLATSSAFGAVKPDNSTITISAGVISSSAASPLTTKGDIFGFSTVSARIPVGSNAQVLTADSTQALGVKWAYPPIVVQYVISAGIPGTNVGAMFAAPRNGTVTKCVVCTKASDGSTALSFRILQNGVNVFSSNPSVAAGTGSGTVTTTGTLTSNPLNISANDVFSIDILTGTGNWIFSAQLE